VSSDTYKSKAAYTWISPDPTQAGSQWELLLLLLLYGVTTFALTEPSQNHCQGLATELPYHNHIQYYNRISISQRSQPQAWRKQLAQALFHSLIKSSCLHCQP